MTFAPLKPPCWRAQTDGRVNVLLNLGGLLDFTIDMALEELRFVREHEQEFGRIAIVAPRGAG